MPFGISKAELTFWSKLGLYINKKFNMNNLAVVQVRTKSKRLPNKALLPLDGIPMIGYMLERLRYSKLIDKILVATTSSESDNKLSDYVKKLGIEVYRGSTDDVLKRVYKAAKKYCPDSVIRLTGDCPLIDPIIIDDLILDFCRKKADYSSTDSSFAEGLDAEIIKFNVLKICYKEARLISEREHITQYIHNNKSRFKMTSIFNNINYGNLRIVVDEIEDYEVISKMVNILSKRFNKKKFFFDDIRNLLMINHNLVKINSNIVRNEGLKISLISDGIYQN